MRLIKPAEHNVLDSSDNSTANNINNRGNTVANNDGDCAKNVDDFSRKKCCNCEKLTYGVLPSSRRIAENPLAAGATLMTVKVEPIVIRKTPKFPSRERHMAIRRKKCLPSIDEFDSRNNGASGNQVEK